MKTNRQKYLTEEEFQKFLSAIPSASSHGVRNFFLFYIIGCLGLRVGEGVRLRYEDIDWKERYIRIPTLKQDKKRGIIRGTIQRGELPETYEDMPIDEEDDLLTKIKGYCNIFTIKKGWLFPDGESHIPTWKVQQQFKRYAAKAGLNPSFSVHSLRHYKGVKSYDKIGDIRAVQMLLRHKDISSTQMYTQMGLDQKRKILEKMRRKEKGKLSEAEIAEIIDRLGKG